MSRVRYSKSSEAPKLLNAAIALGVNGVTDASTEVEKLAAIASLQDNTATYTNSETALLLETLANKVLISKVFKRMQFKDKISKHFFTEGTTIAAAKEIFDVKVLQSKTFDPNKRYPDTQTRAATLNVILNTVIRAYITNTIPTMGLKAAFASEQGYGEWTSRQIDVIQESLQLEIFKLLTTLVKDGIKNTITLDPAKFGSWDEIFIEVTRIANHMQLPLKDYNLGFDDAAAANASQKSRTNVTQIADMLLMGSPDIENALKGKVSTVKFHNEYFDIKKFKDFIALDVANDELELVSKNAFEGHFRVNEMATQAWAANKTIEYFLHYWIVFGAIPWANGVKIKFTNPDA